MLTHSLIVTFAILFVALTVVAQDRRTPPDRGLPDSIKIERDINYAAGINPAQSLDVYVPRQPKGDTPLPAIVNIHGGAFMGGDKSMGIDEIIPLVSSGEFVGVSINYRLTGEAIWPAQINDCKAAIRWVRANASKYNIDPDRIAVIGASAGGHLVAMLGLTADNKDLEGAVGPHTDASSKVQCVIDMFGPTDLLGMPADGSQMDHNAAQSPEGRLIGGEVKANTDRARAASPLTYVSKNSAPFLMLHGSADPIIPPVQSERLYKSLKSAGGEAYLVSITGAGHGGFRNPEVARRIRQFLGKQLLGETPAISEEPIANQ